MGDQESADQDNPDFTAGPFVARRNPTGEIESLLDSLYLHDGDVSLNGDDRIARAQSQDRVNEENSDHTSQNGEEALGALGRGLLEPLTPVVVQRENRVDISQTDWDSMQNRMRVLECHLGALETTHRESVSSSLNRETSFRESVERALAKMEQEFQDKIEVLEKNMVSCLKRRDEKWQREISTLRPTSTPINQRTIAVSTDMGGPPPLNATFSMPGVSPFYFKPPVRLDFPTFGPSCETADVLSFVEQVENFLELRPLSVPELMGTLSSVLRGPALSWWKAAKGQVLDWSMFKETFLNAFLPTDYMAEVEEKLRELVQQPDQRLRDFAYDYQALCLKWKPDMSEEEIVRRILNNTNPKVAGCLRGTVHTVTDLVKVGSMVEKDCGSAKGYWQKVHASTEGTGKRALEKRGGNKFNAVVTQPPPPQMPRAELLLVPLTICHVQGVAVVDTGSTYTLMRESLWRNLHGTSRDLIPSEDQRFVMADGTTHVALGKQRFGLDWHGRKLSVEAHVMDDRHLAFPMIIGLDFLTDAGVILDLAKRPNELSQLINARPTVTSSVLGKTTVEKHTIYTQDEVPVKSRAYRVSPLKKRIIEEHVEKMLDEDIIEPSQSSWSSPVVMVDRPDGRERFCIDFRKVNAKILPDAYPMPIIHEILESLEVLWSCDLSQSVLWSCDLSQSVLWSCDLSQSVLWSCDLSQSVLWSCDLSQSVLWSCDLSHQCCGHVTCLSVLWSCDLSQSVLWSCDLSQSVLWSCDLSQCCGHVTCLSQCCGHVTCLMLWSCDLSQSVLWSCDLSQSVLWSCDLSQSVLWSCDLSQSVLWSCDLSLVLWSCDLSQSVLWSCDLSQSVLWSCDLSQSVLWSCDLSQSVLWSCDLSQSVLWSCDLSQSVLWSCDLSQSVLWSCDLSQSVLWSCDLSVGCGHVTCLSVVVM
uniref:Retrotransposon gag domain-containing protein n=1 Tax=Knipowitschia caucasica TaxID=637954 RepID=A0AAV2M9H7_KNICA